MTYYPIFPKCPYRAKGTRKCSNKECGGICIWVSRPEKCGIYSKWIDTRNAKQKEEKTISIATNTPQTNIPVGGSTK